MSIGLVITECTSPRISKLNR